jgi:hypothetical protein
MARLCERPGCSDPADVTYGIDPPNLLVWLDAFNGPLAVRAGVLCRRHADAMVVPLGWMLDDRREAMPRLFRSPAAGPVPRRPRRQRQGRPGDDTEQLHLEPSMVAAIPADPAEGDAVEDATPLDEPVAAGDVVAWQPVFDQRDDLSGLLSTTSSLLSRAFNGTPRDSG